MNIFTITDVITRLRKYKKLPVKGERLNCTGLTDNIFTPSEAH